MKILLACLLTAATLCSAATQRVPGSRVIIDTTGFEYVEAGDATLQGILDWMDSSWLTLGTGLDWNNVTNVPTVWPGTIAYSNITGAIAFSSVTNLPTVWPGYATGLYAVVDYGTVTNTSLAVTNGPNMAIITLGTNVTFSMATDGYPAIFDGYCLKWRVTASGTNRTIYFPTNTFRSPSSASMVTNPVVTNGTTSVFLTEYNQAQGKWMLQAYVWGF